MAHLIKLPLDRVQTKLSEMILDQKLRGTLDQGQGVLILYEASEVNGIYSNSLASIKNTQAVRASAQICRQRETSVFSVFIYVRETRRNYATRDLKPHLERRR